MYLGWGEGYRKGPQSFQEPFIDPGQADGMPVLPGVFWGKALQRARLVWHLLQGFRTQLGAPEARGEQRLGRGAVPASAGDPSKHSWQGCQMPPQPLDLSLCPLLPEPLYPHRQSQEAPNMGTDGTGMSLHWEKGTASGQTQAGRMAGTP